MEKNVLTTEQGAEMTEAERQERRRRNRRFNAVLYAVSACLILAGAFIILRDQTDLFNRNTGVVPEATFPPDLTVESPAPEQTAWNGAVEPTKPPPQESDSPAPTGQAEASDPVSVYFEGHDISVAVIPVGVNENGEMDTIPRHDIAGWYMYGPAPGEGGNCIIAGHNRYHGQKGLFAVLHKGLKVGDKICVTTENGGNYFYSVDSIDYYRYDEVPESVMAAGGETRLTLITCKGDFDYDAQMSLTRVVAVCRPID